MRDDLMEEMRRDKEIILNCQNIEEYINSTIAKAPKYYSHYAGFENCFWTIKMHPEITHAKRLKFPKITDAGELFEYLYTVNDGVGNKNEEKRIPHTYFINSSDPKSPIKIIENSVIKAKGKPWVHCYVKLKPILAYIDNQFSYGLGSFELFSRDEKWLIIANGNRCLGSIWLCIIDKWNVPTLNSKKDERAKNN